MLQELSKLDSIIGGLLGLFGGVGAVIIWEIFIRPLREGRALAEVLAAEISFNLEYLVAASLKPRTTGIGVDFSVSTSVFDSTVDRIGMLPPRLVGEVVFLYRYSSELNQLPKAYADLLTQYRSYGAGTENKLGSERELKGAIAVFGQNLDKAIKRIELVQPLLLAAARPWWSWRTWRSPKPIALDVERLRERMERATRERDSQNPKQ
jgi:hypothetical protein